MSETNPGVPSTQLIVFSDDWGRHPSSCQHLIGHLVKRHPVLWVNTIGMRAPSFTREDLGKVLRKLHSWARPTATAAEAEAIVIPPNMKVINPRMWPGFRTSWQRRLNARWMSQAVHEALGPRQPGVKRVVLTTLPITADLVGKLDVDRWVYYCVDDFSVWPGLDGNVMCDMEEEQVSRVDQVVAVSRNLQERLSGMGRPSQLLTHGIEWSHWAAQADQAAQNDASPRETDAAAADRFFDGLTGPILLFWGLIDPRLDLAWCQALSQAKLGNLVLVGPQQSPDSALASLPGVRMTGPAPYALLPRLAKRAAVLVMPYADLPVTRAMQPLKFKEYLATGKPVVARKLPGIEDWQDAADLVTSQEAFVQKVAQRLKEGLPADQGIARQRLTQETWEHKAAELEKVLLA